MDAPARVGAFLLLEPIGRGGMAEVWRARHHTGLEVAIKLARSGRAREQRVRDAFVHEARAVARLRHRNIVRLYEVGTAERTVGPAVEGAPYLVMELAAGTLADRAGALPWATTRATLEAILDALAHAHARSVIHRDVKPSNVLLAADGRPMLADFGLASAFGVGHGGGTPGFMAPEQRTGALVGPRTDLYGLGCLAWALVGGHPPWQDRSPGEPLPALPARARAPAGFLAWVQALTEPDPKDRPVSAADARATLDALGLPGEATEAEPLPSVPTARTESFPPMSLPATIQRFLATEPPTRWAEPVLLDPDRALPAPSLPAPPAPEHFREQPPVAEAPRGHGLSLVALREPPVIGRAAEQRILWEALRDVAKGHTRVVVLQGPDGSGRSHLGRWALRVAHEHGLAVQVESRAGGSREQTTGGLLAWLREVAGVRAAAWLVEDLHLDPVLAQRVREVVAAPIRPPLLVVITTDPAEPPPDAILLELGPLTRRDGLQLVEDVFGLRGTAADQVVERAAGNPGLAVALVRDWSARGLLTPDATGFALPEDFRPGLPQPIQQIEAGRIARLSPQTRAVLEAAAVIGGVVSEESWRAVGPYDRAAVELLEEQGFVEPTAGGMQLVRPSLASAVQAEAEAAGRWTAVCARYAAWAQDRLADQDGPARVQLARAQEATGRPLDAARGLERAGTLLRRQGRVVASSAALLEERRLLTELNHPPGDVWVRNAFQLALNTIYQHRYAEAEGWIAAIEQAQAANPTGGGRDCVWAARGRLHHLQGDVAEAQRCYAEAERIGRAEDLGEVVAYMLQSQGTASSERGRVREALPLFDEAEATYRALGNERDATGVAIGRAYALDGLRDPAAGPLLDQLIDEGVDDPNVEITARILRGNRSRREGAFDRAEVDYRRALRLVMDLGTARLPMPLISLAAVALDRGEIAQARRDFLAIEGSCSGMYAQFWRGASLPAFALDPDFDARLDAFVDLVRRTGRGGRADLEVLEHAARIAQDADRIEVAARCRAAAEVLRTEMAGLGKDALEAPA